MAVIYDLADTWADGATTFTAIKMNVTDTASASGSLLMDLQVGGSSKFAFRKDARLYMPDTAQISWLQGTAPRATISSSYTGYQLIFSVPGHSASINGSFGFQLSQGLTLNWGDLYLVREASDTLAMRRSTNAQTFNLYNTYTDASNYERGVMKWNSNVLEIGTQGAGTGSARNIKIGPSFPQSVGLAAGNATGGYAVACGASTASASYSFAAGGSNASGPGSMALGRLAFASGTSAIAFGYLSSASQANQFAIGFSRFAASGDCQTSIFVLSAQTTDATPTEMITSFGGSSKMVVPANTTWAFEMTIAGRSDGGTDNAMYIRRGLIKRDGAGNTTLVGAVDSVYTNETNAGWDVAVTADDTAETLAVTVTGAAATNINWTAKVSLTEVGNV